MNDLYEGRVYANNKNGTVQFSFGTDMANKLIGDALKHKEDVVAKWDSNKNMLIIKRKRDVVRFDEVED